MPMPPMPTKWIGADVERDHGHGRVSPVSASTASSRRSTASGRASARALGGHRRQARSGACIRPASSRASRSAREPGWGTSTAAPASARARALAVWWSSAACSVGHQQRRAAQRQQLGHGRGAGAGDHQVGRGHPAGHVGEEARELRLRARARRRPARTRSRSSGRHCWARSRRARSSAGSSAQRRRHHVAEDPRTLAAAEHEQAEPAGRADVAAVSARRTPGASGCR